MPRTYRAIFGDQVFTRKTDRIYTHVIIGREAAFVRDIPSDPRNQKDGPWYALSWAGNPLLAEKKARSERKAWKQVKIIPCEDARGVPA